MSDHGTMRWIAADYRRQAEAADTHAHRIRLIVLANCCNKMAETLARRRRPVARAGIDPNLSRP